MNKHFATSFLCVIFLCFGCSLRYKPTYMLGSYEEYQIYSDAVAQAIAHAPHKNLEKLRSESQARADDLWTLSLAFFHLPYEEPPQVLWKHFITVAGHASCTEPNMTISLNEILFLYNYDKFMDEVIPHEIAHLIACKVINSVDSAHTTNFLSDTMRMLAGISYSHHDMDVYFSCQLNHNLRYAELKKCKNCDDVIITPTCGQYLIIRRK